MGNLMSCVEKLEMSNMRTGEHGDTSLKVIRDMVVLPRRTDPMQ